MGLVSGKERPGLKRKQAWHRCKRTHTFSNDKRCNSAPLAEDSVKISEANQNNDEIVFLSGWETLPVSDVKRFTLRDQFREALYSYVSLPQLQRVKALPEEDFVFTDKRPHRKSKALK